MLHLSLLHLRRSGSRWRLLDPYQAHQLIWKAFLDVPRGDRPFLFSLDDRSTHHSLLVQSSLPPDWAFLSGDATIKTKALDPTHIPIDEPLRFSLRANPTVDRKGFRDGKKRRVAVGANPELAFQQMGRPTEAPKTLVERAAWRERELKDWLRRKGERSGFSVEECAPGPIIARQVVRTDNGPPRVMTFHEVDFTGTLRVNDKEAFTHAYAHGLGRGKAFGYGLLMVRPA